MANPRQRSKAKSHKSTKPNHLQKKRIHARLRKTPRLQGPEALQAAWDKKKTVFQNYRALGLLPSIPVPKGASARAQRVALPVNADGERMDVDSTEEDKPKPAATFGRIIRDADGNVIDIIIEGDDEEKKEAGTEGEEGLKWAPLNEEETEGEVVEAKTEVVKQLEAIAATAAPVQRHSSAAERVWLTNLVKKHGDDYADMARDRKLNVWQKTPGELKRMIKKAGGVEKLLAA